MRRGTVIVATVLAVFALLGGLATKFIQEGFEHELPMQELQQAQQHWRDGLVTQALDDFVSAEMMALECGLRYAIARPYIDQMHVQEKDGRLREALDTCIRAVQILDGWDQEGLVSYDCDVLEYRVRCTVVGEQIECPP